MNDLIKVRKEILSAVRKNKEREKANTYYTEMLSNNLSGQNDVNVKSLSQMEHILDIREYDVPYHVRVSIDNKIFCGSWYDVKSQGINKPPIITKREDLIERPDPIVLAFDIETTKLPLKFPDAAIDQIMMISYMINGQGYLITNRQIISCDVADFNYTPKLEYEGNFIVFNEANERSLLIKFFEHIMDVRPHIFVTYNGDFFDWPFVEARAATYNLNMKLEIGFNKGLDGVYSCRPSMHMDCLCWVKRDSYLPVGSQNLKAVAKAKLRYDPVELDPEDMETLAIEQPQVLSNYSVSDAVATYYLYMKYVHPFIFALCTIIPMEPDEVLRKGSGTLCEALLMVEAFHANIIFPNKQITELNKLSSDGHVLHQETYVGGHVEALESGVFRADIPCKFRLNTEMFTSLIDKVPHTMKHAIEVEEGVAFNLVENFDAVCEEIKDKLSALKASPNRLESPIIYHLDVGAMYPNIILTNRLQPSAMVDETQCAACDFNRPGATCQRSMAWMWRGEFLPATRGEYQRIKQQLETEKFPPAFPGGKPRAFHQLSREEQAEIEKKRLNDYCKKAYNKTKVTRVEEKYTTICQKENSFYVDTVRAFRDRRYEYKGLSKKAKQQVNEAVKTGNAELIKSSKNREILYDSLQLAHKCILNSFYGYVMRRGARWHSMEMAGIVCHTGANIIMEARKIIDCIGRPLELDTDGIWCVLPASFPETFIVTTKDPKKPKLHISYPNAVLNAMVKEKFTNDQYHELIDSKNLIYEKRNENSIFFEVDGPYLAMVLPASKEEGKKLKKRYAVFNFDGSLAELKGFEVKRRGELQLIKIFQSSVFESFLKGQTLEECYASVAKVADYWLDVLFSKGANMPDTELFELISENRSMSKKLEEYGQQKSTSISTAKRLAEFLGDQMVKDKGLACKFIISRQPMGAPVTERAIPLAIFQADANVKRHYLRKWMKDNTIQDIDIRDVLDWDYYIERLGGTIQKIITIPAAMQGLPNPVPRIKHPDWLHKKIMEKNDVFKQRRINDIFTAKPKEVEKDIEDLVESENPAINRPVVTYKRKRQEDNDLDASEKENDITKSWREVLGPPPSKENLKDWVLYQQKKWEWQAKQRNLRMEKQNSKRSKDDESLIVRNIVRTNTGTLGGFLKKTQLALLDVPWQIVQIRETNEPGIFKLWALVGQELHQINLEVPRILYVNQREKKVVNENAFFQKCNRILPRSRPVYNLYRFSVAEQQFIDHSETLMAQLGTSEVEGIYETQVSLEFRAILQLGCLCSVKRECIRKLIQTKSTNFNSFSLEDLQISSIKDQPYLTDGVMKHIFFYHNQSSTSAKAFYGLFMSATQKALIIVVDTVRTKQIPNLNALYTTERQFLVEQGRELHLLPPEKITFDVHYETELKQVYRILQRALLSYRDEKQGPTFIINQSLIDSASLIANMPEFATFPIIPFYIQDVDTLYNTLEWQKVGARTMLRHYLGSEMVLKINLDQSRYFYIPLGNLPKDIAIFGTDLFFARFLQKNNFILWCSSSDRPDLGGREADDNRLLIDINDGGNTITNTSGCYDTICVELHIDGLAVNTLLQSHHVNDVEGTSSAIAFTTMVHSSLKEMVDTENGLLTLPTYDETALCEPAFRILRSMVNSWLRDVSLYQNVYADFQIMHFYRWLRSTQALLYEPALRKTLHNLMKKLFIQLLSEFKRLGAVIIYANFNRLVICTKKKTINDAIAYVEYIVQSVRNKELFHSIQISYDKSWEYLLWLDEANFGGIVGKLPTELKTDKSMKGSNLQPQADENDHNKDKEIEDEEHTDVEDEDEDAIEVAMNWNLIKYLPMHVRTNFNNIIGAYINTIYEQIQNYKNNSLTQTPVRRKRPASQCLTPRSQTVLGSRATASEYAKEIISGELSQKLFEITQKIQQHTPECQVSEFSHASYNGETKLNTALEFVKALCKVLSLDSNLENDIYSLRRNLLCLIGIGEFSDLAVWSETSISYVLPDVICQACNHCRDIDLGKDNYKVLDNDELAWACTVCDTNYDILEIEGLLLESFHKNTMAYTLQDLQCKKCSEVKMENFNEYCSCSSEYKPLIPRNEFLLNLKTLNHIARMFKMSLLLDTTTWHLSMNDL